MYIVETAVDFDGESFFRFDKLPYAIEFIEYLVKKDFIDERIDSDIKLYEAKELDLEIKSTLVVKIKES